MYLENKVNTSNQSPAIQKILNKPEKYDYFPSVTVGILGLSQNEILYCLENFVNLLIL